MCSMYVATINLDLIGHRSVNSYLRLVNALTQVGWQYSGTSATVLLDGDLSEVLMALRPPGQESRRSCGSRQAGWAAHAACANAPKRIRADWRVPVRGARYSEHAPKSCQQLHV